MKENEIIVEKLKHRQIPESNQVGISSDLTLREKEIEKTIRFNRKDIRYEGQNDWYIKQLKLTRGNDFEQKKDMIKEWNT